MEYDLFNIIEALFWIALGISVFLLRNARGGAYRRLALYAAAAFTAFGLSDVAEVRYGSYLNLDPAWLFVWKSVNLAAIIYIIIRYLVSRIQTRK